MALRPIRAKDEFAFLMRTVASRKALLLHEWARPLVLKSGPVRDVVECAKQTASVDVWRRHCEHDLQPLNTPHLSWLP
jgi:hypothetical protein